MYSLADKDFRGSVRQSSLVKFKMLGISLQAFSLKRHPIPIFFKAPVQSDNFPNVQFPNRRLPKGYVRPAEAPQAASGPSAAARMG